MPDCNVLGPQMRHWQFLCTRHFVSDGMREIPALFSSWKRQPDFIACLDMRCRREAALRVMSESSKALMS